MADLDPERNRDPERGRDLLTYEEAAQRLSISRNAVRLRVRRGSLPVVSIDGNPRIPWSPELLEPHTGQSKGHDSDLNRGHERDPDPKATATAIPTRDQDSTATLITAQRDEIAYLRQLLDAEREARSEERRRSDAIVAGLVARIEGLPATVDVVSMPQDAKNSPVRGDLRVEAPEPMQHASNSLALVWRRWWRRMQGG